MKYEVYAKFNITDDFGIFDFFSVGKRGCIHKRIEFTVTLIPNIVNLAFGDIEATGEINDHSVSDNGDRNKILATVAYAVELYLNQYPERWVYFKGSTQERTRLYRMAVGLNLDVLTSKFEIYAELTGGIAVFKTNMEANGFLVRRKKV